MIWGYSDFQKPPCSNMQGPLYNPLIWSPYIAHDDHWLVLTIAISHDMSGYSPCQVLAVSKNLLPLNCYLYLYLYLYLYPKRYLYLYPYTYIYIYI
jgi:hypothetical protein